MSSNSGRASCSQSSPTTTVVVYRNGDEFFPGKRIVVNPRQVSTFDTFLSAVTSTVAAPFGAVRSLYTPREGHRVLDLSRLQHGETYVAAGTERFKKLDYFQITAKKPISKKREEIRPVVHSRIIVPARWRRLLHEPRTINVFTNGDILTPPARIVVPRSTLRSWETVLAMVTERVRLRTGAVHRLNGTPLSHSAELENNHYYVATGAERFRLLPYSHWVPRYKLPPDGDLGARSDFLPPSIRRGKHTREQISPAGGDSDPANSPSSSQGTHPRLLADSHFYAQPERAVGPQRHTGKPPHLLSPGEGSVFRAPSRRKETAGAIQIPEDGHLKVDLPIDQVEAGEVEEEQCETAPPPPPPTGSALQTLTHGPAHATCADPEPPGAHRQSELRVGQDPPE